MEKIKNYFVTRLRRNSKKRPRRKSPIMIAVTLSFFFIHNSLFAQWFCEKLPATGTGGSSNSNALMDSIIIGVSIIIVLFTLIMSIKYLFKPGEKDPNHIKNIVKDEGF